VGRKEVWILRSQHAAAGTLLALATTKPSWRSGHPGREEEEEEDSLATGVTFPSRPYSRAFHHSNSEGQTDKHSRATQIRFLGMALR